MVVVMYLATRLLNLAVIALSIGSLITCSAFLTHPTSAHQGAFHLDCRHRPLRASQYVPPAESDEGTKASISGKLIYPMVGDVVRYYDLDGGKAKGQLLIGKISFIQKKLGKNGDRWLLEVTELEDLGEGYYGEYPARQRNAKTTLREVESVSPVSATFVRTENAFKVPVGKAAGEPLVRAEQYDIEGYEGPFSGDNAIDFAVLEQDALTYAEMKGKLFRATALAGLAGTVIADFTKGTEDAIIYAAGVAGSLLYLLLLSVKTDTVATEGAKFGKGIAGLRWTMPFLVLAGVAIYNLSRGDDNPMLHKGLFGYITAEQYGAAIFGFLTYRIPLFILQLLDALKDESGNLALPGSAGVALQLLKEDMKDSKAQAEELLATVLLVSGPQATGRSELVQRLIADGEGRFVAPSRVDSVKDGSVFDRLKLRDEFLAVDQTGRYGLTKEGVLKSAKECGPNTVVVVDADVNLAKKLTKVAGLRLVGVWVGLGSVGEFEKRLEGQIANGEIIVPNDETRESVMRARIKEIVKEIEYGISSGIFEFTVFNRDEDESMTQLREASSYCFK